jgi:integrase/recombinase XerD
MARARTTTLWMYVEKEGKQRYVRVLKSGNGRWVPKVEEPYAPGSYYLRYRTNEKRVWESVGTDLQLALAEQKARQAMVTNERQQQPATTRKSLAAAIGAYVIEVRTRRSNKAAKRQKQLLELFANQTKKQFIDEITRDTLFFFMAYLKDQGKSPKTLRDRIGSIETFLQRQGIPKLMKKGDLPKVTKKIVDCYTEEEVSRMLAVANEDEQFLIQFLLATGVREQEAAHMTWDDVKIGSRSVRVTAKPDCQCPSCGPDGFNIKDFEEREVPDLDDWFVDALTARKAIATRDLLFFNRSGNPQGHILYMLKSVGERAGIKCKNCVVRDGKLSCKRHVVNTHKFRRTFATWHHVLGGVSIAILQKWLGHSDVETTMRYIATTEIRPGLNRERAKLTWTGIATKPKLLAVAS